MLKSPKRATRATPIQGPTQLLPTLTVYASSFRLVFCFFGQATL